MNQTTSINLLISLVSCKEISGFQFLRACTRIWTEKRNSDKFVSEIQTIPKLRFSIT